MIKVTDHAIVRYLERVLQVDLDSVREVIVRSLDSRRARRLVEFGGGARCRITADGIVFCMRGHTVTTILGDHRDRRPHGRRAGCASRAVRGTPGRNVAMPPAQAASTGAPQCHRKDTRDVAPALSTTAMWP